MKFLLNLVLIILSCSVVWCQSPKATAAKHQVAEWHFVASGDSRNCGDFVMPTIAEGAARHQAAFYWHLGDFRWMRSPDQDLEGELGADAKPKRVGAKEYPAVAWDDFLKMQVAPFEKHGVPVFLGIGNHELISPKDRAQYIDKFAKWIDAPVIHEQRVKDNFGAEKAQTYYHWQKDGVDFINLDNGSNDQFDAQQLAWLSKVLTRDRKDKDVTTIVVGMHKSLPDSLSNWHSMGESDAGIKSGRCVYKSLVKLQNEGHKRVYVLSSHSHFYMPDIYNTEFWRANQSTKQTILPGWIVGTAGAVRYRLPENAPKEAQTDVYGYLLATVNAGGKPGEIKFEFKPIKDGGEDFVGDDVKQMFSKQAQDYCLNGNSDMTPPKALPEPPDVPCPE